MLMKPFNQQVEQSIEQKMDFLNELLEQTLKEAKLQGATAAEMSTSLHQGFSVTVRNQNVETVEFSRDKGIGVTVYFGQKKGTASSTDTDFASIKKTVQAACQIAQYTQEDPHAGLADAELMARDLPDLALNHPWELAHDEAITIATNMEQAGLNASNKITNSEGASVSTHQSVVLYGNTHGFIGAYPTTRHSMSCVLIAGENGKMQRDYDYSVSRDHHQLLAPESIGQMACEKTIARLGARKLTTRQCPVIFSAPVARSLWSHFFSAIKGGAIYRQSSFLCDHLHKSIFPEHITIHDNPFIKGGLASAPFDGEGVATVERDWIKDGILQNYILSSYTARQLGMQTTGNAGGVHNITISHSPDSLTDMLQTMNSGLLVTEFIGHGVNIVNGDYSRGCAGFWIENGEIQFPVEEITIAGNLKDMFKNIIQVGSDIDTRSSLHTGSVLLEQISVAGN